MVMNTVTYQASEARKNWYNLIITAASGLRAIEINLRNVEPVVMLSKAEYESWLETLEVMMSPSEIKAVRRGREKRKILSHEEMRKTLGL